MPKLTVAVSVVEIKMPEHFLCKSKNPTINMLENIIFNLDQLQVENYVKREPKFLFKVKNNRSNSRLGSL